MLLSCPADGSNSTIGSSVPTVAFITVLLLSIASLSNVENKENKKNQYEINYLKIQGKSG